MNATDEPRNVSKEPSAGANNNSKTDRANVYVRKGPILIVVWYVYSTNTVEYHHSRNFLTAHRISQVQDRQHVKSYAPAFKNLHNPLLCCGETKGFKVVRRIGGICSCYVGVHPLGLHWESDVRGSSRVFRFVHQSLSSF
jgi:hypothetical protein